MSKSGGWTACTKNNYFKMNLLKDLHIYTLFYTSAVCILKCNAKRLLQMLDTLTKKKV